MAQTTQLISSVKAIPQPAAQVIALDSRTNDKASSSKKYLRMLELSDWLSRNLEVDKVIEAFISEISRDVEFCGYQFISDDIDMVIEEGITDCHNVQYRLKIQNRQLGQITLYRKSGFASDELCDIEELLCALIYPIKNAMMYRIALKSAYRDPLTGLNNRTSMEKHLPREIDLAKRHRQSMSILVMDLDGFKRINDECGHDVGDQVLREVGRVIIEEVRHTDLVYRFGGDEFVSGLSQTDINGAIDVSERIRSSIDGLDLSDQGIHLKVQTSIGITMVRQSDDFSAAFKRADKALYQAKVSGKNQIIIC
ncbi:MAG: diguanylate cyclase (GGDEF)-like protein [Planctomycetota bacterium]|jgi:diguanylate cyclase (GGDEF)-like protein